MRTVWIADALESRFGADASVPNPEFGGGSAWPCPVCDDGRGRTPLTLFDSGTVDCLNGCSTTSINRALGLAEKRQRNATSGNRGRLLSPSPATFSLPRRVPLSTSTSDSDPAIGIEGLACDKRTVAAALRTLGINARPTEPFTCVLPCHSEIASAAYVAMDAEGVFQYFDECEGAIRRLTLGRVRATMAYDRIPELTSMPMACWYRRLFCDAGVLTPVPIELPSIQPLTAAVAKVARGFELLVGLRWLTYPNQPVTFGRNFAGPWSGVSVATAYAAIAKLVSDGVIDRVGTCEPVFNRRGAYLYLPGSHGP